MRAILLAAGYGTRLRPLTDNTPKCLVPIHGRALLDIWLERLSSAGIGPFLVSSHYLSAQVRAYIGSSLYSELVTITYEEQLLGTAGTVILNVDFSSYPESYENIIELSLISWFIIKLLSLFII